MKYIETVKAIINYYSLKFVDLIKIGLIWYWLS
jgi:hypothetical protein